MKQVFFFIAGLLTTTTMALAQSQTDSSQAQSSSWQAGTANYQNYPTKDMRKLNSKEIPASLRTTLQGREYSGWENGTLYFNSSTNEYFYQPGSNSETSLRDKREGQKNDVVWYRFDSKGQRLRDRKPQN